MAVNTDGCSHRRSQPAGHHGFGRRRLLVRVGGGGGGHRCKLGSGHSWIEASVSLKEVQQLTAMIVASVAACSARSAQALDRFCMGS